VRSQLAARQGKVIVSTAKRNQWFLTPRPNPQSVLRLFCFPYAGGGTAAYHGWAARLPRDIEVSLAQLPGREARLRETPLPSAALLVEALGQHMLPYLDKPFAFFGHSMGAVIAFELARHLRRVYGVEPQHLFVSARRAPQLPSDERKTYQLPDREFLSELRKLNGTPKEVLEHEELMLLMLPLLRADFAVCQTHSYVPGVPLAAPITAFGGLQDNETGREKLAAWGELTSARFRLQMLPGDHFFVKTAQAQILQTIERTLAAELSRTA
jgi:medium-chain acyl-[acyl-carrier-protein] hydrolase